MKKTNNWLEFAKEDLKVAELSLKEAIFNQVCFHSQQCAEKALKAYLEANHKPIPKTHFLDELLNLCSEIDKDFEGLKERCSKLDDYYIPTRYPDALPGELPEGLPDKNDASEAISFAKEILKFLTERINR